MTESGEIVFPEAKPIKPEEDGEKSKDTSKKRSKKLPGNHSKSKNQPNVSQSKTSHNTSSTQKDKSESKKQEDLEEIKKKAIRWFFGQVNTMIEPVHQRYFGLDTQPSHSHTLWIVFCGFVFGALVCYFVITASFFRFLDSTTTLFYIFIAIEYTIMLRSMKNSKWPDLPPDWEKYRSGELTTQLPQGKAACIIPVGWGISGLNEQQQEEKRAAKLDVLGDTLESVQRVFHPEDIYVVHNSSQQVLPDLVFADHCKGFQVNYCPVAIGSKSVAVYYGGLLADRLGYSHCLIMDDDVRLDPALGSVLQQGRLDADAYAIGISAVHENPHEQHTKWQRMLVDCQNAEYCLSDVAKLSQASWMMNSTVLAPHGALSLWKTKTMIQIMLQHDGVFDGEDYQMGVLLALNVQNSRLGMITKANAATVCPENFKDLYRQRKNSWDLAAHQHLFGGAFSSSGSARYLQVICCLPMEIRTMLLRIYTAMDVWTAIQDWFRVLLIVIHIYTAIRERKMNWPVVMMYGIMFISQWVAIWALLRQKLNHRPDLKPSELTTDDFEESDLSSVILFFPFYRFALSFVRVAALGRFLFRYSSIKRNAFPMMDMDLPVPPKSELFNPWKKKATKTKSKKKTKIVKEIIVKQKPVRNRNRRVRPKVIDYYAGNAGKSKKSLELFQDVQNL